MAVAQPNVIFVFADQMRAQATGYAGDPNARTPTLDHLACESVNLTHAVSGHPVCCPYRASLLTGRYPLSSGVYVNDVPLSNDFVSIAEVYAEAGYGTAYVGKWHLYGSPDGAYGRRSAYIPPESRQGFEYWKAFECSHNYMHSPYYAGDDPEPHLWEGYDAIAQTKDACEYIRAHADEGAPFFLMLSWGPPHDPYDQVPASYAARFKGEDVVLRPNVPAERHAAATKTLRGYYAHIAALDDCVAALLDTLGEVGIAEDTLFVFTSDHGDMHYSQGLRTKHCPWDESIRVPFLLRYPALLGWEGQELDLLIDAPDIMPTLLGLCGLVAPNGVQGEDLSPAIRGEIAPDVKSSAFLSVPVSYGMLRSQGLPPYRGVRTRRHTYVRSTRGPWLLYDNEADPYQLKNLCGDPQHAGLQDALEQELQGWLARLGDEFLPGDAYVQRDGLAHYEEVTCEWGHIRTPWTQAEEV
ncbi:MAG: sulfatase family protein [Anaerolineae bacterium]